MTEEDIKKIIAAKICTGQRNIREEMKPYIFRRQKDGMHVFDIKKFWDKLVLAARVLVTIENSKDIACLSEREYGKRAVLKFAMFTEANAIAGKYTPGTFTNQITKAFCEPRILLCQSPHGECQAITEASYMNMPVIAFCNSDANLKNVDVAIPCNNNAVESIGTCWWLLCRQLMRFRGKIPVHSEWDQMPDLFFHRDADEEQEEAYEPPAEAAVDEWGATTQGVTAGAAGDGDALLEFDNQEIGDWADLQVDDGGTTQQFEQQGQGMQQAGIQQGVQQGGMQQGMQQGGMQQGMQQGMQGMQQGGMQQGMQQGGMQQGGMQGGQMYQNQQGMQQGGMQQGGMQQGGMQQGGMQQQFDPNQQAMGAQQQYSFPPEEPVTDW